MLSPIKVCRSMPEAVAFFTDLYIGTCRAILIARPISTARSSNQPIGPARKKITPIINSENGKSAKASIAADTKNSRNVSYALTRLAR